MAIDPERQSDPTRFGTEAFYASIGRAFVAMCAFVPVLFLIEYFDRLSGHRLDQEGGIRPHHVDGLDGIVFAPFLHVSFDHVLANSIPLILLGTFVLAAGAGRFWLTTVFIAIVAGVGVWFTGAGNSVVVGASGVIFGYLGVILMRGVVERSWWHIAVGLLIGLLYGWQLTGVLPGDPEISWQGHLFGFVGGLVAAILFRRRRPRNSRPVNSDDTLSLGPDLS
ncbi:rhomboid family intramembrane serine protease [Dactylosporangium sp. CA-092794]|uniref:rhomboid family intramembrane serine protease n=1 Tax=Dactylosporangium sp. CA-092794 TaxID=3239929 RepID=UPI003D8D98C6